MSCDQQQLQVSPNTYHPHARKGYGRSHHSTPKTLKDVLSSKQKYFQQNTTQQTPWNIWLSVCKGGAACLFPWPCWVQESQPKMVMQDNSWQEPVCPQWEWPGSRSRVWAGPWAPCTLRCVCYLTLRSGRTGLIHWFPPLLISLPHFDMKLIALFPTWNFCTLEVKLIHRTFNLFLRGVMCFDSIFLLSHAFVLNYKERKQLQLSPGCYS